jgi:hypothetical protein
VINRPLLQLDDAMLRKVWRTVVEVLGVEWGGGVLAGFKGSY